MQAEYLIHCHPMNFHVSHEMDVRTGDNGFFHPGY